MDIHKNARLTLRSREDLVQFVAKGRTYAVHVGLHPNGPRKSSLTVATCYRATHRASTGLSAATVSRILKRAHLNRWRDLHPRPPVLRYEHPFPGDLLHLDIKGVTRYQQVSIRGDGRRTDGGNLPAGRLSTSPSMNHSRLAFSQLLPNQQAQTTIAFLHDAKPRFANGPMSATGANPKNAINTCPGSSTTTSPADMVVSATLHLSAAPLPQVQRLDRSQPPSSPYLFSCSRTREYCTFRTMLVPLTVCETSIIFKAR
jgi:hypothetical protein